ncbi:MAG: glycoside hydrolase family 130 protein [Bacteroidota bacterium]|nr:glycoside hydrolase family 130 protein [Bacteroidota bacterium]MDP4195438.1 glycoside hydrolase family 130 protein [Bacteroidota bacterium]
MGITRYNSNPVLTKENVPFRVNSIFNAGAVKFKDDYLLLCRVEMPNGRSSFVLAKSKDGFTFEVDPKPCLSPEDHKEFYEFVEWGIEDARITRIKNKYYLTYTGYSNYMPLVMLAETEDFKDFEIIGPITEPSNKDCALFPEKIDGFYWKMDRPSNESRNYIWVNKSPDLLHWGDHKFLLGPTPGTWEADKVGGSTPPIKTKEGWLLLYHGVRGFGISGDIYKISVMLLDIKKPWRILGRSKEPILMPEMNYERIGDVGNVVFTNGWVVDDNGAVKIYYSGADSNICLATTTVDYLLSLCI